MFTFKKSALTWYDVRVGIFILVGTAIILTSIFFLQPGRHLGSTFKVRSIYSTVGGLTQGAPVMMSGVQVGTVTNLRVLRSPSEVPSNQNILNELKVLRTEMDHINISNEAGRQAYRKIERKYTRLQSELKRVAVVMDVSAVQRDLVGANSSAMIKNQGLVGDKYIDISTSGPEAPKLTPVADSTGVSAIEIPGTEPVDMNQVLQNASGATSSLEDVMNEIDTDITEGKGTIGKLIKDPSVHDNLKETLKETARATHYTGDLMQNIKEGKGTIGKMFTNSELYDSANNMLKSIDTGSGTLGKLIHDPGMYNDAQGAMRQMNSIFTQVNEGNGTLHHLIHNPSLYRNTDELMKSTGNLIERANQGKGSLGRFATDESFYTNTDKAMAGLAELTGRINKGEGTLGALLQDKHIYNNLTTFSDEMVEFMKEFRKNPRKYLRVEVSILKFF